ncbi:DUF1801 domain-containing protein [Corynebacterium alimapuense]|uniref:YdhG-like domain-containing protein n=1 Tax=Corynebacterium alimapuense TaxID=1576874 RepID=A0A3M8K6I0_9CORY|nr:DUF1801 domain-containing protein [Corynebacterium alimapuense]RNE48182.1 hypothetical protein C5L39_09970 [Corynebacterium alimapuense]
MPTPLESVPGIARSALDALAHAGFVDLESLDDVDYAQLAGLRGVGKRSLERAQDALAERGGSLGGHVPERENRAATFSFGATGENAADIKTHPQDCSVSGYIDQLDSPRRVEHGRLLLEIFGRATDADPVLWGSSMIGYGQLHYRYATGREGDTFRVGFSPRKAKISLYGLQGHPDSENLLAALGKHDRAVGCIYVNKPADIDLRVLETLIRHAWHSPPNE